VSYGGQQEAVLRGVRKFIPAASKSNKTVDAIRGGSDRYNQLDSGGNKPMPILPRKRLNCRVGFFEICIQGVLTGRNQSGKVGSGRKFFRTSMQRAE
jgi:hypothetical protein